MANRLLLASLLAIVYGVPTFGRLIITPINQLSLGNQRIMNCSSTLGSNAITWTHIPVGQSVNVTIAEGSTVRQSFTRFCWIDQRTANASNLVIRSPIDLFGTFTCSDGEMLARAQLLVWWSLRFSANKNAYITGPVRKDASGTFIIGDVIIYFSKMVYDGNPFFQMQFTLYRSFPPLYLWELIDNTTSPQLMRSLAQTIATVNFYDIASCLSYQHTRLLVEFQQPIVDLLPGSATNSITEAFSRDLDPVYVSCVPNITGAVSGAFLCYGTSLTCHLTANLPVGLNYSWIDLTFGNSSMGPQLSILHSGSYQCNATFFVSGQWQSVSATVYNLTVKNYGDQPCTAGRHVHVQSAVLQLFLLVFGVCFTQINL